MRTLNNIIATFVVILMFAMTIRAGAQMIQEPGWTILIIFVVLLIVSFVSTALLFDKKENNEHHPPDEFGNHTT